MKPNTNQTRPHSGSIARYRSPAAGGPIRDVITPPRRMPTAAPVSAVAQPHFVPPNPHQAPISAPPPVPPPTTRPKTVAIRLTIPRWRRLKLLPRALRRHPRIGFAVLLLGALLFVVGYILGHRTAVVKDVVVQPATLPRLLLMGRGQ